MKLDNFMDVWGKAFVFKIYHICLGREPDPEGLSYYLGRLRKGITRTELIIQILKSEEAVLNIDNIVGLKRRFLWIRISKKPILGWWIRLFKFEVDGYLPSEVNLRILNNNIFELLEQGGNFAYDYNELSSQNTKSFERDNNNEDMSTYHALKVAIKNFHSV